MPQSWTKVAGTVLLIIGHVTFSYNPYFLAYFFNQNSVFLSQQISRNSISTCFFSEANEAIVLPSESKQQLLV